MRQEGIGASEFDLIQTVRRHPGITQAEVCQRLEIDKGAAARRLMAALGCDRLVCAGDAPNDLELLQSADLAFVPRDCDPTIAALDCVHFAAASADGAVGDAIEQLFSGKIAFPDRK